MIYYQDKELVIRDMEEADGTVFVEEFTAQGWHPSLDYYQKRMQERAEGKCAALTAEYQGKQAGYVYLFLVTEEGPLAGKGWPIIVDFNVLKKYQRKGIGGRLMDARGIYLSPVYGGAVEPVTLSDAFGPVRFWLLPFILYH